MWDQHGGGWLLLHVLWNVGSCLGEKVVKFRVSQMCVCVCACVQTGWCKAQIAASQQRLVCVCVWKGVEWLMYYAFTHHLCMCVGQQVQHHRYTFSCMLTLHVCQFSDWLECDIIFPIWYGMFAVQEGGVQLGLPAHSPCQATTLSVPWPFLHSQSMFSRSFMHPDINAICIQCLHILFFNAIPVDCLHVLNFTSR